MQRLTATFEEMRRALNEFCELWALQGSNVQLIKVDRLPQVFVEKQPGADVLCCMTPSGEVEILTTSNELAAPKPHKPMREKLIQRAEYIAAYAKNLFTPPWAGTYTEQQALDLAAKDWEKMCDDEDTHQANLLARRARYQAP